MTVQKQGLQLGADITDAAKSVEQFQNVLEVVEADRKKRPNLWKRKPTE